MGEDGWDLPLLRAALRDARPVLGYLIPDFQNPTGFWASARERAAVARAARAAGMLLVSDESLAELVLEPHDARDPGGRRRPRWPPETPGAACWRVGSLSKPVWGGLRTGWLRGEPQLVRRLALARAGQDVGSPILDQLMAIEVLRRFDTLLPARREWLRERRDALLSAVARERPQWRVGRPAGGMALWVELPEGTTASRPGGPRGGPRRPGRAGPAFRRRRRL